MKKTIMITGLTLGLIGSVLAEGLVDGGFKAAGSLSLSSLPAGQSNLGLYNAGDVSALDQGWFSGSKDKVYPSGATEKYAEFASFAGWNKTTWTFIGQMFTDTQVSGNQQVSFKIVLDDYTDDNTQTLGIEIFSIPEATSDSAKLRLDSNMSSYTLLGSDLVDISAGNGSYTSAAIDFTATSDLYAIRIKAYSRNGANALVTVGGEMGLTNVSIAP